MYSISVVICNYNYAIFVEDSIESVLQQEVAPYEIIVVDDGSTDDSREKIQKFSNRVQIIYKENEGQCSAYNTGIARAKGDFILLLDSDDKLLPCAIGLIQRHLDHDTSKVQFRLRLINRDGKEIGMPIPRAIKSFDALRLARMGLEYPSPPASGNAYRRDFVQSLLPIPVDKVDKYGADFFLIYAAPYFGKIVNISEILGEYRLHKVGTGFHVGNSKASHAYRERRVESWRNWLQPHLHELLPTQFSSFASRKGDYAASCLSSNLFKRFIVLFKQSPHLLSSILATPQYSMIEKAALITWVVLLPFLPTSFGRLLSLKVCDPSAR
jgi:glycosyltransferase involved in cell wall biosynthesis